MNKIKQTLFIFRIIRNTNIVSVQNAEFLNVKESSKYYGP
jgi:hypothetical protein